MTAPVLTEQPRESVIMKKVRTVLTAVTAALALTTPAHAASNVSLTTADDGKSVAAALGDDVTVRLTPTTGNGVRWVFGQVLSSDPAVAERTNGTVRPDGGASATFSLAGPGEVELTSTRTCVVTGSGGVCPGNAQVWRVTLTVS